MLVHALEHGRVEIQYRADTLLQRQRQLEMLLAEPISGQQVGFDQLLFENNTGMPYATAWQNLLACPTFNDQVFDALRASRAQYVNKGCPGVCQLRTRGPVTSHAVELEHELSTRVTFIQPRCLPTTFPKYAPQLRV